MVVSECCCSELAFATSLSLEKTKCRILPSEVHLKYIICQLAKSSQAFQKLQYVTVWKKESKRFLRLIQPQGNVNSQRAEQKSKVGLG